MLIQPSIDELEKISEDRYLIATLASRRARDVIRGKRILTEEKEVSIVSQAAKEMASGYIGFNDRRCETCTHLCEEKEIVKTRAFDKAEKDSARMIVKLACGNEASPKAGITVGLNNFCDLWEKLEEK